MSGALQRLADHALMLWAGTGTVMGQNLGMRRHKTAKRLGVFIIYGAYFVRTKIALFLYLRLSISVAIIRWAHIDKLKFQITNNKFQINSKFLISNLPNKPDHSEFDRC